MAQVRRSAAKRAPRTEATAANERLTLRKFTDKSIGLQFEEDARQRPGTVAVPASPRATAEMRWVGMHMSESVAHVLTHQC